MAEEKRPLEDAIDDGHGDNAEICRCACHNPLSLIVHVAPCCRVCLQCGQRIRREYFESHQASHEAASSEGAIGTASI